MSTNLETATNNVSNDGWAIDGIAADSIPMQKQYEMMRPLENLLDEKGYQFDKEHMILTRNGLSKQVEVFPAMLRRGEEDGKILIRDAILRQSLPDALNIIEERI